MSKITIIGSAYPYRGGLAAFNERLAREFILMGNEVTVHTFTLQYPGFLFPGKTQYSTGLPPSGLRISRTVNSIDFISWPSAARKIMEDSPELAIIKYWIPFMAPSLGTIARQLRKKGVKVISIADNIVPHEKRPGDTLLTRYFIRSVDGFVVMSEQVGKDLDRFDPLKPRRFNPHPLFDNFGDPIPKTEARKKLGIDPSAPVILFFGFIRDYKGLDLLLEAMARKDFTNRSAKLLIAGEFYTDPGPYRQLIKDLRLAGRVILHDRFIADHEVSCYFSAADLVVQPYRHATQSGVTQIAYHFDKPMIVTDVGGLPEMIPNGVAGYVVPAEPAAIAKAMEKFYQEEKEIIFTRNIKREKLKFSWGKMATAILDLGRDII